MSKRTGKRRRLNYKPMLLVAGIAIPVIVILVVLTWPTPKEPLGFVEGPRFDPHLSAKGNLRIEWRTNKPMTANVKYRFDGDTHFDEIITQKDTRGMVSIPGSPGKTIHFQVELPGSRDQPVSSRLYSVQLLPPVASRPATASAPKIGK